MEIILRDYEGNPTIVEIPEEVNYISGMILSGDMVMTDPFFQDTSDCRDVDCFDGYFKISKHNFEKMNSLVDSYDIQELD